MRVSFALCSGPVSGSSGSQSWQRKSRPRREEPLMRATERLTRRERPALTVSLTSPPNVRSAARYP